jgi:hypothetical protein
MARSAHGLDTGVETGTWREDAACRSDPDLWFESGSARWAEAAHICLRHCPVLEKCGTTLLAELRRGVRPQDAVVAGVRFNADRQPRPTNPRAHTCVQCQRDPRDDPETRAAIAAYTSRKAAEAGCGTAKGIKRHEEADEPLCRACEKVRRIRDRNRK